MSLLIQLFLNDGKALEIQEENCGIGLADCKFRFVGRKARTLHGPKLFPLNMKKLFSGLRAVNGEP